MQIWNEGPKATSNFYRRRKGGETGSRHALSDGHQTKISSMVTQNRLFTPGFGCAPSNLCGSSVCESLSELDGSEQVECPSDSPRFELEDSSVNCYELLIGNSWLW